MEENPYKAPAESATTRRPPTLRELARKAAYCLFVLGLAVVIGKTLAAVTVPLVERDPYLCLMIFLVVFGFYQVITRKTPA